MARGDMLGETIKFGFGVEILNRPNFTGVPMTIDFTNVTETEDNGKKVVRAGTPISGVGVPVTATPWTGATGILLVDVYEERPQGTLLTEAYIHVGRAQENSGLTYDGSLVTAMNNAGNRIRFEEPLIAATASAGA